MRRAAPVAATSLPRDATTLDRAGDARLRLLDLQRGWRAPAELLAASTPRDVRFTRTGRALIALCILVLVGMVAGAVTLIPVLVRQQREATLVRREGVPTRGTITNRSEYHGKSASYNVRYQYRVGTGRYEARAQVTRRAYAGFTIGAAAPLHYAVSRPELSDLDGAIHTSPWLALFALLPFALFCLIPLGLVSHRRLLAWGTPAGALITRISPAKSGEVIHYEYLDPTGEQFAGSDGVAVRGSIKTGDVVAVLFDPDRPKRNARYPLRLVRLVS